MASLRDMMAAKKGGAAKKAAPPASGGLKLSDPSAPEPGELQALSEQKADRARQLDQGHADGEQIPNDYPSESASAEEKLWWQARHGLDQDLAIWIEPDSGHAWLAVKPPKATLAPLILLMRLPLANNVRPGDPF